MQEVIHFFRDLAFRIGEADVMGLSAQIAYFLLLSLFPFLLFLVTLMGFIPMDSESFLQFLGTFLPADVLEMIETNLRDIVDNRSGGLLSLGIIGTIWSASNGFNAITKSFNKAYRVEENRSFWLNRLIAIGLMFGLIAIIAVALIMAVFGHVIGDYVFGFLGLSNLISPWNVIRWVITSVTLFIGLFILYKLAPNKKVHTRDALWGTLFATIAWQITSLGFSFYVDKLGNYSATYGSLGTVVILMVWFYLSGIIITTGGVLNAYLTHRNARA